MMYGLCRSLHHALLTKRSQVLRDKLTELEKKKQQLRIDSGQDSQSIEEMVARKESLQQSLNELHARLELIERDKTALGVEEDQQYAAESTQQVKVNSLQKNIEAFNREMEAKKATIAENEDAIAKLQVGASQPSPLLQCVFGHDRPLFFCARVGTGLTYLGWVISLPAAMAEQKDLERLEPQIKQNKEKQDKTKKEFNAVDSEKEKLSALERKSDYASQVSPFLFLPVPVMQGRWMGQISEHMADVPARAAPSSRALSHKNNWPVPCVGGARPGAQSQEEGSRQERAEIAGRKRETGARHRKRKAEEVSV